MDKQTHVNTDEDRPHWSVFRLRNKDKPRETVLKLTKFIPVFCHPDKDSRELHRFPRLNVVSKMNVETGFIIDRKRCRQVLQRNCYSVRYGSTADFQWILNRTNIILHVLMIFAIPSSLEVCFYYWSWFYSKAAIVLVKVLIMWYRFIWWLINLLSLLAAFVIFAVVVAIQLLYEMLYQSRNSRRKRN